MASPNPNPQWQFWQTQPYPQSPSPPAQSPHGYPHSYGPEYTQYMLAAGSYVQPHYSNTSGIHMIAELPAPLPPSPSTTTPDEQLKQDELLARKMHQMELEEARRKSESAVGQHQRPVSMMPQVSQQLSPPLLHHHQSAQTLRPHSRSFSTFPDQQPVNMVPANTQQLAPLSLAHHRSAQSLRPHSQSVGASTGPWNPESFASQSKPLPRPQPRPQIDPSRYSTLPEVVVESHPVSYYEPKSQPESYPTPVLPSPQQPVRRPSVALNPSSLPAYLEQYRQAPYPPQWTPPPPLCTFYAHRDPKPSSGTTWLDTPSTTSWKTVRHSDPSASTTPAAYTFKFKVINSTFRAPKFSWTMTSNPSPSTKKPQKDTWAYELKLDPRSNLRKSEVLTHENRAERPILTTYIHALNYDSLRFIGPDGRAYMWVTSSKLSCLNGARYDTLRHALFVATGNVPDPLYGQIVADHCFWDGYSGGTGHVLPDEAVNLRARDVDPAVVVATLQVMKDWEKTTLRAEKARYKDAFGVGEEEARRAVLGRVSYWKA
ncbi:hypothetical protein PTNB85_10247 [Pyrenophora teres f. teres]|nr:hypothetical protein PTNB85_10247 [Pyrenophora teres f. teres]KAE8823185.1 hypothetical protein HRS9139_09594 [Pyrenophora teres f. teres]KAE8854358.1 hypothetical protein PTNB29_09714 [Pyrenophora teres f. teres]CAE7220329.1 PAT1 domain containing protein [Pyrenophora teres f. teres]